MLIPLGILDFPVAAGSYDLLETEILTSEAASVTFSSLGDYATNYQHLQLRTTQRCNVVNSQVWIRLNSDSGSNYSYHYLETTGGGSVGSGSGTSATRMLIGRTAYSGNPAGSFGTMVLDFLDPFETTKYTTARTFSGVVGANNLWFGSGLWMNTNSITSIEIQTGSGNWIADSRFSLYGWKVA